MTRPRSELVDLDSTTYYHCICRCVRRAFLCGEDHLTSKNYEHRKGWVVDRLAELSNIFAIDICAYAVMSNHYHVVLRVDPQLAERCSNQEVIDRWQRLFSLPLLVVRYQQGKTDPAESKEAEKIIQIWRERLIDISWFMRALNEYLARKANKEDQCKGRFWEGRFKSQALLDETAILMCMSYVDLNPIRAGIADLPETSDFTSIKQRIQELHQQESDKIVDDISPENKNQSIPLLPLTNTISNHIHDFNFNLEDYLKLIDWAGRVVREGKRGYILSTAPPILERLQINPKSFIAAMEARKRKLSLPVALGCSKAMEKFAQVTRRKFVRHYQAITLN